ncbi:hypothetical protein BH24ACT5_BH24ACT5_21700 [soil metagenome]
MTGYIGFSPEGVTTLRSRTSDVVADLSGLTLDDPEAAPALTTARLIRFSIETNWLPRLTALVLDTSMTAWAAVAQLARLLAALGAAQAGAVDEARAAAQGMLDGDPEAVAELNAVLAGLDPAAAAAFLAELGPDDYLDVMMRLGQSDGNNEMRLDTAVQLRDLLAHAPDGFVDALAGVTVSRVYDWQTTGEESVHLMAELNPQAAADFLSESTDVGMAFTAIALTGMVAWEQSGTDTSTLTGPQPSVLSQATDGPSWVDDPVAAALSQIAIDPALAREMFSDTDFARYVVLERDYTDGLTGMMAFVEAAAAGPDVATAWEDSSLYATQSAFWLSQRDIDMSSLSDAASVSASHVLTTHLVAAETTIQIPESSVPLDAAFLDDPQSLPTHTDSALGMDGVTIAIFDHDGLATLTDMTAQSDEGIVRLRYGLNVMQETAALGTAEMVQDRPGEAQQILDEAMTTAGHTEGYFIDHIGAALEANAADADRRTGLWISTLAAPVPSALKATPLSFLSSAVGPTKEWLTGLLATEQDAVIAMMTADAQDSVGRITFQYAQALLAAGVVETPAGFTMDLTMSYDEFQTADPTQIRLFWGAVNNPEGDIYIDTFLPTQAAVDEQNPPYVTV